eukprot:1141520-Pelagomonas_calceolata.AAC.4
MHAIYFKLFSGKKIGNIQHVYINGIGQSESSTKELEARANASASATALLAYSADPPRDFTDAVAVGKQTALRELECMARGT